MARLSSSSILCSLLVLGCTPIAPLEYDGGAEQPGADAGLDAGSDSGTDGGCHPALLDLCDGADDDCDPSSADGSEDPAVGAPCDGADSDLCAEGVNTCAAGALSCDDATADSAETCFGMMLDEDCDGAIDEDGAVGSRAFYPDADMDAYGDDAGLRMVCSAPTTEAWAPRGGDCDDADPLVRPGRAEQCNARDDDCDGTIDESAPCGGCETASFMGHAYLFCENGETASGARTECQRYGYDLVVIEDAAENAFVNDEARRAGVGGFQGWWIGLSDVLVEGDYRWVDGTAATYVDWGDGEPNGSGDCVRQGASVASDGWADGDCTLQADFVCEIP